MLKFVEQPRLSRLMSLASCQRAARLEYARGGPLARRADSTERHGRRHSSYTDHVAKLMLVMDEADVLLHPLRSELNFPIGHKVPIDLGSQRWNLPLFLLDSILAIDSQLRARFLGSQGAAQGISASSTEMSEHDAMDTGADPASAANALSAAVKAATWQLPTEAAQVHESEGGSGILSALAVAVANGYLRTRSARATSGATGRHLVRCCGRWWPTAARVACAVRSAHKLGRGF